MAWKGIGHKPCPFETPKPRSGGLLRVKNRINKKLLHQAKHEKIIHTVNNRTCAMFIFKIIFQQKLHAFKFISFSMFVLLSMITYTNCNVIRASCSYVN